MENPFKDRQLAAEKSKELLLVLLKGEYRWEMAMAATVALACNQGVSRLNEILVAAEAIFNIPATKTIVERIKGTL